MLLGKNKWKKMKTKAIWAKNSFSLYKLASKATI